MKRRNATVTFILWYLLSDDGLEGKTFKGVDPGVVVWGTMGREDYSFEGVTELRHAVQGCHLTS